VVGAAAPALDGGRVETTGHAGEPDGGRCPSAFSALLVANGRLGQRFSVKISPGPGDFA
jgi:hypothetical protein